MVLLGFVRQLTYTMLWANSADDTLMIFFLFSIKNRIEHLNGQCLFSEINKKNIPKCHVLKLLSTMLSINCMLEINPFMKIPTLSCVVEYVNCLILALNI